MAKGRVLPVSADAVAGMAGIAGTAGVACAVRPAARACQDVPPISRAAGSSAVASSIRRQGASATTGAAWDRICSMRWRSSAGRAMAMPAGMPRAPTAISSRISA